MKQNFLLTVVFCLLTATVFSQTDKAQKFDEFVNPNCEDYLAKMDYIIIEALNSPSAKIYFLVYEGKEEIYNRRKKDWVLANPAYGSAKAKIRSMKKYLLIRGGSPENISFVEAGFREKFTVEVWLVPNGGEIPKPTPTLEKIRYRKGKPTGFCTGCCG